MSIMPLQHSLLPLHVPFLLQLEMNCVWSRKGTTRSLKMLLKENVTLPHWFCLWRISCGMISRGLLEHELVESYWSFMVKCSSCWINVTLICNDCSHIDSISSIFIHWFTRVQGHNFIWNTMHFIDHTSNISLCYTSFFFFFFPAFFYPLRVSWGHLSILFV